MSSSSGVSLPSSTSPSNRNTSLFLERFLKWQYSTMSSSTLWNWNKNKNKVVVVHNDWQIFWVTNYNRGYRPLLAYLICSWFGGENIVMYSNVKITLLYFKLATFPWCVNPPKDNIIISLLSSRPPWHFSTFLPLRLWMSSSMHCHLLALLLWSCLHCFLCLSMQAWIPLWCILE